MRIFLTLLWLLLSICTVLAQQTSYSSTWNPALNEREYRNPIIHADYSDPDVVRVGSDYYMTASSFTQVPGLPLLHSKDMIHWNLIGHALPKLIPEDHFSTVQHGGGVWAPSIRYHKGEFYIYYPDPDFGIYLVKAKKIEGPWSSPQLVLAGKDIIDPCPLWDDDGKAWLVHAYAGSRAGIKSILVMRELSPDGSKTLSEGKIVYDGHEQDPTVEGPKLYKRNGWYYIFAPAGGVSTGWQLALRSKNIYGPYERRVVMAQGNTNINGPHQGAWVTTREGTDWFFHFQDREAYGRIVHLQPMIWKNDWPIIGVDKDGDGTGEPLVKYTKPVVVKSNISFTPPESDEFDELPATGLSKQWQWQANPKAHWSFLRNGQLRLYAQTWADSMRNMWTAPHLLMQKWPADKFETTSLLNFYARADGDKAGLILFGADYGYIALEKRGDKLQLLTAICLKAEKASPEKIREIAVVQSSKIWLRVRIDEKAWVQFSYSADGQNFVNAGEPFEAKPGKWVGAKMGLFCNQKNKSNDAGYVDVDWFRVKGF